MAARRDYQGRHREEIAIRTAAYRQRPGVRERTRARVREYAHRPERLAVKRQYERDHPEQRAAARKRYRELHHDEIAAKAVVYRQRPAVKEQTRALQRKKKRVRPGIGAYQKKWREKNLQRVLAKGTAYRATNRATLAAKSRKYAATHADQIAAFREANRERLNRASNLSRKLHPDAQRNANTKRRARKAGAEGPHFGVADFRAKAAAMGNVCVYCGKSGPLVADHDIPLARKELHPTNDIGNILPACSSCNSRKKDRTAQEFRALLARQH